MSDVVKNILACRKVVEREINRSLTTEEKNIVRIAFLNGQNTVYNDIIQRTAVIEKKVKLSEAENDKLRSKRKALEAWIELADVPVDEDDNTESEFKHFPVGTSKFDIWHWFEDEFDVSVAEDLMKVGKT
jgi:hypothetical protein